MAFLIFNGRRSDDPDLGIVSWKSWNRPLIPETRDTLLEVPGRDGVYDLGRDYESLNIECEFVIKGDSPAELRTYARQVSAWLSVNELKELIFSDEPDKFYMARVTGLTSLETMYTTGICKVVFFCPDPYAYSTVQYITEFENNEVVLTNSGTAPILPKYEIEFLSPASFLTIISPDKYILIGDPAPTEQTPIPEMEIYLHDNCSSLSPWSPATSVEIGTIGGSIATDGNQFFPSDFGTGSDWHGPALVRDIPNWGDLQDFRMDVNMIHNNLDQDIGKNLGRIVVTLLTSTNEPVYHIEFQDYWIDLERNVISARLGSVVDGKWIWHHNDGPWVLDGFVGKWRIDRQGKQWLFWGGKCARMVNNKYYTDLRNIVEHYKNTEYAGGYTLEDWAQWNNIAPPYKLQIGDIVYFPNNNYGYRRTVIYHDEAEQFQKKPAKVMIQFQQYQNYHPSEMSIQDIIIYKLNNPGQFMQPLKPFNQGDVVEIDTQYHTVRLNGVPNMSIWDIGSDFFSLPIGETPLEVQSDGNVGVKVKYRTRWL